MNAPLLEFFVSSQMGVSVDRASQLLTIVDKSINEVLDMSKTPLRVLIKKDLDPEKVDVNRIAQSLDVDVTNFSTWIADGLLWVLFGRNFIEGVAGEGPTPEHAVADFYRSWYKRVLSTNDPILMSDGSYYTWHRRQPLKKIL